MDGLSTMHEEFTPATGDPIFINYLIEQFDLRKIIKFDESNRLITTTIQHNQHIRLSDLLSLNVFYLSKQTSNVIGFTLPQYMDIILLLIDLFDFMNKNHINHGNIQPENILLDFTKSQKKLDDRCGEIQFELKLINFAQFNNEKYLDDFTQMKTIYQTILLKFPELSSKQEYKEKINDYIKEINNMLSQQKHYYVIGTNWQPENIQNLNKKYKKHFTKNFTCSQIIANLHKHYLIMNYYVKLNNLDYYDQPKDFRQACQEIENLTNMEQEMVEVSEQLLIKYNITQEQVNHFLQNLKVQVQDQLVIYLKQQGYFKNINQFIQIIQNSAQVNIFKHQLIEKQQLKMIDYLQWNSKQRKDFQLPDEFKYMFIKSADILKYIIQTQQHDLINTLHNIRDIGFKYSKLLIDNFVNERLGKQIKEQKLPKVDNLIWFMVDQWLKWIDEYIFLFQFNTKESLDQINKQKFIQFIEEKGFKILKEEFKKLIEVTVNAIFLNIKE